MASDQHHVDVRVRWWLRPALFVLVIAARLGVPVSQRFLQAVADHGVQIWYRGRWQ